MITKFNQVITFEKDKELSKKAQNEIMQILLKEKARNINIDFRERMITKLNKREEKHGE